MVGKNENSTDGEIRKAIDEVDEQILHLIGRRLDLVRQLCGDQSQQVVGESAEASHRIASLVNQAGTPTCVGGDTGSHASISNRDAAAILRHISATCLQSIRPMRVAFLGPEYSYSHLAAIKYFGDTADFVPVASIPAVFDSVTRGDASIGMVPIENNTDGRIVDTLGMLVRTETKICGEVVLAIHHNLLSRSARSEIREIHSKPQALSQCRTWLAVNMPEATLVEVSSTTAAASHAAEQPGVAAVASLEAGRQYDLDVLNANIEDNRNNVTRFAILGRELPGPSGDDKTSLLFQVHHQPGALADVMKIFKDHSLNLTWIESFPAPNTQNEYLFFVELTGHRDNANVAAAIDALKSTTCRLEVLGSYPRAALN